MRNHFHGDGIQEIEVIEPDLRGELANRFDRFTVKDSAGTTKPALGLKLHVDVVLRQVDGGIQKIKELVQRYGGKFIHGKETDPLHEIYDPIIFEDDKQLKNFRRAANKFLNDEVAKFYDELRKKENQNTTPAREETKSESKTEPQPLEKETDEKQATEELKAKTKAELEEILEADKYPSIQEYLDDNFKTLEYESLEAAQRGRDAVLKDAHNMKAGNRVAEFAAVRLHRNWMDKVTGTHSYDRTLDRKLQGILGKMRDGKITGEKAYEKMDDLLSGRAQEKANAKRAGKQEKRNQLTQKLKDDLAQILDLNNHPSLKEYLYTAIAKRTQDNQSESFKKLKEWCDDTVVQAKGIRDKGKIEEWEERAKERLPKKNDVQEAEPTEDVETRARKALDEIGITQKVEGCHVTDGYPGVEKVSFRIVLNKGASLAANVRDVIDKIANYFKAKVTHEKNPEVSYGGGVAFVSTFTERDLQAARRALEICFSDDFDKSGENSTTDETEQQNPNARYDIEGDKDTINTDTSNTVAEKDLTPAQKLLVSFGKKLGVRVVFFDNPDENFRGVHRKGVTYLNVNGNKELGKVFWHESLHWLRNNNQRLYQELVKAEDITDAQRKAYLEKSKRTDLNSNDEINEKILCDMMDDVAKRTGLFQSIAGKNRGLIERVIQWFKDTLNEFIDHFRNPQGKLTTAQAQALASEFGRIANQLKDPNGNQIFRYNRRTRNVKLADGREWSDAAIEAMTAKTAHHPDKYSFAGKNAKTANKESLARAKKMDERGADRDRIYETTGWFKGKDGKWRFEIPDNFDQMDLDKLWWNENAQFRLEEIYDNPALFEAYPKLRDISISASTELPSSVYGETSPDYKEIALNRGYVDDNRKDAAKTLVHEIQHVIQKYEKFAVGGAQQTVKLDLDYNASKIIHESDKTKAPYSKKYFDSILAVKKAVKRGNTQAEAKARKEMTQAAQELSSKDRKKIEILAERYAELKSARTDTKSARVTTYERLGGEQEARHVEERLFNREGTPVAHDADALIIYGGKTYPISKQSFANKKTPLKMAMENWLRGAYSALLLPPTAPLQMP